MIRVKKPDTLGKIPGQKSCVIAASAGTGKTFTLEHLVVDAVLNGTKLDEILVVTFTRRATAEMQGRIRRKFESILEQASDKQDCKETEAHWEVEPDDVEAIQRALDTFDDASISTIHAFCQNVLSDFAFASGELFDAELVDEKELFDECFYDVLRSKLAVEKPYRPWLEAWLETNDLDDLADQLRRIYARKAVVAPRPDEHGLLDAPPNEDLDSWQLSVACWEMCLEPVAREMERRKAADGLMTYQDLLEKVRDGLDDGLAELLRDRYKVVLVDEFQDTDPVQWEIFRKAFLDAGRCLYVIGDEKQAIYGFRGADVGTYQSAIERGGEKIAFAKTVQLPNNYRSSEELIEAYNAFFGASFFGGDYEPVNMPDNRPVRELPGSGCAIGAEPIEIMHLESEKKLSKGKMQPAFINKMAAKIDALLNKETARSYRFSPDGDTEKRALQPGDIYVLTRTNKEADQVGEALASRGVPHSFYRKPGLFETDEALHVLRLLRAIARPGDRSRRRKAMLTPFFGIELDDLTQYDHADEGAWTPRRQLEVWRDTARRRGFVPLFDRIMSDSGVVRRELLASPSERRLTNYRHIFDWLLEQAAGWRYGVEQLADTLQRYRDGNDSDGEEEGSDLQRLETDRSSVQIMTIHKSKGLAAEVVFLCGGFSARASKASHIKTRILSGSSEHNDYATTIAFPYVTQSSKKRKKVEKKQGGAQLIALDERYDEEVLLELERLFYVAITRAKAKVYLPSVQSGALGAHGQKWALQPIADTIEAMGGIDALDGRPGFEVSKFTLEDVDISEPVPDRLESAECLDDYAELIAETPPSKPGGDKTFGELRKQNQRIMESYSSLAQHSSDRGDAVEDASGFEHPLPKSINAGSCLHMIMEFIDFSTVADATTVDDWLQTLDPQRDESIEEIIAGQLEAFDFDLKYLPYVASMAFNALQVPLKADSKTLPALKELAFEHTAREVGFVLPLPDATAKTLGETPPKGFEAKDGYLIGEIDLLFDDEDGRVYFADWKSDTRIGGAAYDTATLQRHIEAEYREQAAVYTVALMRMLGITTKEAYERDFGGFFYLFLRGMPAGQPGDGYVFERVPWSAIESLHASLTQNDTALADTLQGFTS